MTARANHWNQHARQWDLIGPPLRPATEDIRLLETEVNNWRAGTTVAAPCATAVRRDPGNCRHALAVGDAPDGGGSFPADDCRRMAVGRGPAVCGDWRRLPLADGSQHLLIGDGCYSLLVGRESYAAFAAELRRVAAKDAMLAMRYFVRPEQAEPVGRVVDDLWQQRIGNFHVFKWRFAMALHGTLEEGVRLGDIWNAWCDAVPDPARLAAQLGWRPEVVHTIHNYRDVDTRYSFPTLAEARALIGEFAIVAIHTPAYELGDRCPTLIMRPA